MSTNGLWRLRPVLDSRALIPTAQILASSCTVKTNVVCMLLMLDNIARMNARVVFAEDLGKWSQAIINNVEGTSLVVQWLRLHLPM